MNPIVIDGKRALLEVISNFVEQDISAACFVIQAAEYRELWDSKAGWLKLIKTKVPKPLKSGKFKQSEKLKRFVKVVGNVAAVLLPTYLEQKQLDWNSGLPHFFRNCGDPGVVLLNEVEKALKDFDIFLLTTDKKICDWYAEVESYSKPHK